MSSVPAAPGVRDFSVAENASVPSFYLVATSTLIDPANTEYAFYDFGSGGGYFVAPGLVVQPANQWIYVPIGNLNYIDYVGGASPGSETLAVAVYNANYGLWSAYSTLTATTTSPPPSHVVPVVNVQNVSIATNASITASSMITSVSNPSGDRITAYEFQDLGTGGGHFTVNGVIQPANTVIEVLTSNLSTIQYVGGSSPGSETLTVAVYDYTTNTYSGSSTLTATTAPPPAPLTLIGTGDFDANSQSDIAFANGGKAVLWTKGTGGFTEVTVPNASMGAEWTALKTADFDGDGRADILWTSAGNAAIWLMNGANLAKLGLPAGHMGGEWHVAGVGDFNGDHKADILWTTTTGQADFWLMNGATLTSSAVSDGHMGAEWSIATTGDLDGDGKQDLLWVSRTGDVATWLMNGANLAGSGFKGNVGHMGSEWHVAGNGDFNRDGISDIVWLDTNNNVQIWTMNAGRIGQLVSPSAHDGIEWHLKAVADFTGDSKADLLWLKDNGAADLWSIDGTKVTVSSPASPNDLSPSATAQATNMAFTFADISSDPVSAGGTTASMAGLMPTSQSSDGDPLLLQSSSTTLLVDPTFSHGTLFG